MTDESRESNRAHAIPTTRPPCLLRVALVSAESSLAPPAAAAAAAAPAPAPAPTAEEAVTSLLLAAAAAADR